jgi:PAS domain S-box-containing protein
MGQHTGPDEFTLRRKDGSRIIAEIATYPVTIKGDSLVLGIARDATERKKAEEKLKDSEERYRLIFNNATDLFVQLDASGTILDINKVLEEKGGYKREDVMGKKFSMLAGIFPAKSLALMSANFARNMAGTDTPPYEVEVRAKDGKTIFFEVAATLVKDQEGKMIGMFDVLRDITERKRAEEANVLLAGIVNNSDDAIYSKGLDGTIMTWNMGAEKLYGYSAAEIVGRNVDVLAPPERKNEIKDILEKIARGERILHYETERLRKDGALISVSLTVSPITGKDGKVASASSIARDITERNMAEQLVKDSEEKLRVIFEDAPDGYFLNDLKGDLTDVNKAAEKITGYKTEELIGKNFIKGGLVSPDQLQKAAKSLAKSIQRLPTGPDEFTLLRKDGSRVSVEISTFPVTIGGRAFVLGIARDITERKKAESALIESEEKYRTLVENASDQIFMLDEGYKILSMNGTASKLFGKKADELVGKKMSELFSGEMLSVIMNNVALVFKTGENHSYEEALDIGGHKQFVSTSLSPVKNDKGRTTAVLGVIRDITEQRAAQEYAQKVAQAETERKKTLELLAVVSHELRTPITPIMGYASMFLSEKLGKLPPKYKEGAEIIKKESDRLEVLIEDILDMVHISAGLPFKLNNKLVPLKPILDEALTELGPESRGKTVEVSLPEDLPRLSIDEEKMKRAFSNLLSNACKFTSKDGNIKVTAEKKGENVLFRIIDDGIGLAPENLNKVFEKFFRVDTSTVRKTGGLGLGLAITQEIIEAHGGKIWAESDGLGKGSRFCFTLPINRGKIKEEI